jgi:hypothetical protein
MPCPFIFPIADYKVRIRENKIPAKDNIEIQFVDPLSSFLVTAINQQNIECALGCSTANQTPEYVRIEKNSYNSERNSVILKRGLSPYADNFGGEIKKYETINAGSLILDFGKWRPYQISQLVNRVCDFDENIVDYIAKNLPLATTLQSGSVRVAYKDPSLQSVSSQAITTDNPSFNELMKAFYGNSSIDYGSLPSANMLTKTTQMLQLFNAMTVTPARHAAFLAHINSFPS